MLTRSRGARAATMAFVGLVAGLAAATSATAAQAAPAAPAGKAGPAVAAVTSPAPGLGWFIAGSYASRDTCNWVGLNFVVGGTVSGATCSFRYDARGWDLWLRN